jgi:hypothetical protein
MILNKTLGDALVKSPPKSGEVSQERDNVNVSSLLTSTFGDLRMRTWTQDNVGPHQGDDAEAGANIGMDNMDDMAIAVTEGSFEEPSVMPTVTDVRTLSLMFWQMPTGAIEPSMSTTRT